MPRDLQVLYNILCNLWYIYIVYYKEFGGPVVYACIMSVFYSIYDLEDLPRPTIHMVSCSSVAGCLTCWELVHRPQPVLDTICQHASAKIITRKYTNNIVWTRPNSLIHSAGFHMHCCAHCLKIVHSYIWCIYILVWTIYLHLSFLY